MAGRVVVHFSLLGKFSVFILLSSIQPYLRGNLHEFKEKILRIAVVYTITHCKIHPDSYNQFFQKFESVSK